MNLHQITTTTLTRVALIDEHGRCSETCPNTNYPNDHHEHLRRLWGVHVWYCTCECRRPTETTPHRYIYFPVDEADPPGGTTCRDCHNGVHH